MFILLFYCNLTKRSSYFHQPKTLLGIYIVMLVGDVCVCVCVCVCVKGGGGGNSTQIVQIVSTDNSPKWK